MLQTELILTRHGQTLENRQGIMQGHMPGTLSPWGIRQAEQLAVLLKDERIDVIVCSDLARSLDTAKIVADSRGMSPRPTKLLREIDWGKSTGGYLASMDWQHIPEDCETPESLIRRAAIFIDWLKTQYAGKRVLAVGHGAINRAILAYMEGKSVAEMILLPIMKNTSFYRFKINE